MLPSRMRVEEFTTPDPVTVAETTAIGELRELMDQHGVRHLPVRRDGEVVGVISERDVRLVQGLSLDEQLQIRAQDLMADDLFVVHASTLLDEVAMEMVSRRVGSAIVRDEDGDFLGIFTLTDALNALVEVVRNESRNW
ncbi:CBS domain-containing protein [Denitratimonas tolerans]|uniref:CBS domain-containing protein n=1 Tax=Denitratimonas tolerans TaxID=1338420 RepID=A0AAW9R2R3_9GAMM|nr:CBS domain-containing protein [Xanthomonadaceae bacterium]HRO87791.1 CBS domain-containing protein [Chiayiivirga sp.]